jgi:hypothetical protein
MNGFVTLRERAMMPPFVHRSQSYIRSWMPNSGSMIFANTVEGAGTVPLGRLVRAEGGHHEF